VHAHIGNAQLTSLRNAGQEEVSIAVGDGLLACGRCRYGSSHHGQSVFIGHNVAPHVHPSVVALLRKGRTLRILIGNGNNGPCAEKGKKQK